MSVTFTALVAFFKHRNTFPDPWIWVWPQVAFPSLSHHSVSLTCSRNWKMHLLRIVHSVQWMRWVSHIQRRLHILKCNNLMPVPLSQLSRYLTIVPCSMALMGERRYLGLSSFLSWNSTVFLHVCMHVSTPCLVFVGSYVILIISSQITHNYQFVNYTEKASILEKRGMKILWERKV